jgi:hypothetical protein
MRSAICPSSPAAAICSFSWCYIGQQTASDDAGQNEWVRVTARHHPLLGRVARVVRRRRRDDGVDLVVEATGGQRQLIPLAWTGAAHVEDPAMPALRFTPGSLRALIRLTQAYRTSMLAEARHASRPDPDAVEHPAAGGAESNDCAVGRADPPPVAGSDRPKGGAP